ncbi:Multidrug resistance efflux pump [Dyadobacter koreensis]|uniref:Multidrug resistance efflux pump n=1 Tax=Dyadobacter koreensis TaxID=408657 RepID=A0A1H7AWA8_9BACT|nr:HlyD family efflux transporter periplasmic adaptor subunit [Dyadobacter koreensis]SEJ69883.1 Multidrug resistance efflux pump [Dyadobacter koreensis]
MTNLKRSEENSDDALDFLGDTPGWVVRFGLLTILLFILGLLSVSYFVQYPDSIEGRITLLAEPAAFDLVTRSNGELNLFVSDNQHVSAGQVMGSLDNTSRYENIRDLKLELFRIKNTIFALDFIDPNKLRINQNANVGDLQGAYISLVEAIGNYRRFHSLAGNKNLIKDIEDQIGHQVRLLTYLKSQRKLFEQALTIQFEKSKMDSSLYAQRAISTLQAKESQQAVFQMSRDFEGANISISSGELSLATLRSKRLELEHTERYQNLEYSEKIRVAYRVLEAQISVWEQKYLLISGISGTVNFYKRLNNKQYIETNDRVMVVIPSTTEIFGDLRVSRLGYGKVRIGQKVVVRLDSYPYEEFGVLTGEVVSIANVPNEEFYQLRVKLPSKLLTNFNKELIFKEKMQGDAQVITKRVRLIERFFHNLRRITEMR